MALVAALALATALNPPLARADERFDRETVDVSAVDPLEAIVSIESTLGPNRSAHSCTGTQLTSIWRHADAELRASLPQVTLLRATGSRLIYECGGERGEYQYAEFPAITFYRGLVAIRTVEDRLAASFTIPQQESKRRFARSWVALAQPRTVRDPASDVEFLALLRTAPQLAANAEELRRVQVQVEAAVRANRTIYAARLYRDTLGTAPAWAEGHFNLGLLYGELELYPEAITEMRRYLYLAPNAPDARAVQDRIYEWEAAMAPSTR